jgi:hypothetical protein
MYSKSVKQMRIVSKNAIVAIRSGRNNARSEQLHVKSRKKFVNSSVKVSSQTHNLVAISKNPVPAALRR